MTMTSELQNNVIRELTSNELLAVSGGARPCVYEAANRCYVYGDQSVWDWFIEQVNRAAGL
jgi:hypothetical protein